MADNTYQNIEDLKVGDMIMSYPEDQATRRWNTPLEAKPIISLLVDISSVIWHLNDSMVSATEWIIKGAMITSFAQGSFDWTSSEPAEVTLTVAMDYCVLNY